MSEDVTEIECEKHGKSVACVVCSPLVNNEEDSLGFVENSSDRNDLQGWCYACEEMFLQEEEMTEQFKAFMGITIVCAECYDAIKVHHEIEPNS